MTTTHDYKAAIALYEQAVKNINDALILFKASDDIPVEFEMQFGDNNGNETLSNLEKEVKQIKNFMYEVDLRKAYELGRTDSRISDQRGRYCDTFDQWLSSFFD